jgi:hypothetical protein
MTMRKSRFTEQQIAPCAEASGERTIVKEV